MKKVLTVLAVALCFAFVSAPVTAASNPFSDVKTSDWFYDEVMYAYENKLYAGTSATTFSPYDGMTRGMFVTVLGRMVGIDDTDYYGCDFEDVGSSVWYRGYVIWAYDYNIVNGVGNNQFAPNKLVTREEMATMVANYIRVSGSVLPDRSDAIPSFGDTFKVSPWAAEGLELMRKSGVIRGDEKGNFNPSGTATRAECASIFQQLKKVRLTDECIIENTRIKIKDSYFTKDDENKDILVVRMSFENLGDKETSYSSATMNYAFQDGVELDDSFYSPRFEDGYDYDNYNKKVQKGGKLEIQMGIYPKSNAPVTLEIRDWRDSGFKAVKTFNIQ